jgi:hypothetical protein
MHLNRKINGTLINCTSRAFHERMVMSVDFAIFLTIYLCTADGDLILSPPVLKELLGLHYAWTPAVGQSE